MGVGIITVAVYCDGGYHEPERIAFSDRVLKSDITDKLRSLGWRVTGGKTFCPQHKTPETMTRRP